MVGTSSGNSGSRYHLFLKGACRLILGCFFSFQLISQTMAFGISVATVGSSHALLITLQRKEKQCWRWVWGLKLLHLVDFNADRRK